jgi:hypothetical protein
MGLHSLHMYSDSSFQYPIPGGFEEQLTIQLELYKKKLSMQA